MTYEIGERLTRLCYMDAAGEYVPVMVGEVRYLTPVGCLPVVHTCGHIEVWDPKDTVYVRGELEIPPWIGATLAEFDDDDEVQQ